MAELEPFMLTPLAAPMPMEVGVTGILGVVGLGEEYIDTMFVAAMASIERHASVAMNTGAAELPAKTAISNRFIHDQLQIRRDLPSTGDRIGGFLAETSGTVTLENSDHALDYLLTDRVLRDRKVRVKSAATTRLATGSLALPAMSAFNTNFEGTIVTAQVNTDGRIALAVGDGWKRIDKPIQERLYLGTGGAEGGKDVAGKPVPLSYGFAPNVTPTCVDRVKGIWQVHDGEAKDIQPRDMGVFLVYAGEVDTFEQLAAMTQQGEVDDPQIALGTFVLCRKIGMFRVAGGQQITADVQGDGLFDGQVTFDQGVLFDGGVGFDAPGSRTHRRHAAGIIYRILFSRARVKDSELDLDQMLTFDSTYPFEMGIFVPSAERPTIREVCTRIADSVGAVVVRNQVGQIMLRVIEPPSAGSAITITEANMATTVERLPLPWGSPWPGLKFYYAPNWTPMTDEQISDQFADDSPEKAVLLGSEDFVELTHPEMAPLLPDREALEVHSVLRDERDALVVGRRVLDFYASRWALWRAVVYGVPWRLDVLATVILKVPGLGFADGQPMLVIGNEERPGEYETELTLM
jgi:hypothetical protein